jgi:hypothetical protein
VFPAIDKEKSLLETAALPYTAGSYRREMGDEILRGIGAYPSLRVCEYETISVVRWTLGTGRRLP